LPDFLRVTKPLVTQNQSVQAKPSVDATGAFNLQNTTKVIQTHNQSELLKQNTTFKDGNDTPTLLLNLLRDPTVTVSYLKNVFMLEELYKLLPANNKTVTNEIESVFDALLIKPEGLTEEMQKQDGNSSAFKGELFDFLREISAGNKDDPDVQLAIARLLRSLNSMGNQRDILDSVANNLSFLREQLSPSKSLSSKLTELIDKFRAPEAQQSFSVLKSETLNMIKEIENSILFTPKLSKTLSILVYNLSRFNDNSDYATEAAFRFRQLLSPSQRQKFAVLFKAFTDGRTAENQVGTDSSALANESKVMSSLIKLISQQIENGHNPADAAKMEKMLHSLLSSPCNFTPLLHFILPLQHGDMRAFAEIWINPESDEKDMPESSSPGMHLLMVIDVDDVGRFEAEFFVYNSTIDFLLYCPKGCEAGYEELMKSMPKLLYGTEYHSGRTEVLTFENTRSLMDVFKSLPIRRVGVDVKI